MVPSTLPLGKLDAVRRIRHRSDPIRMPPERSYWVARLGVPDMYYAVDAVAGKLGAVRRIRHGTDRRTEEAYAQTRMPLKLSY